MNELASYLFCCCCYLRYTFHSSSFFILFFFQVNKYAQYPSLIERKGGGSSKEYLPRSPMSPSCYEPIIANFPEDESTRTISNHTLTHYSVLKSEQNALSRSLINS